MPKQRKLTPQGKPAHSPAQQALIQFHRGVACQAAGRYDEAIAAWKAALRLCPDRTDTEAALGQALLDVGQATEAAILLAAAHHRTPRHPGILALFGQALLATGEAPAAIGAFVLALELQPGSAIAHADLATAFSAIGDMEQALLHRAEAFTLQPSPEHACTFGAVLIQLGRFGDALTMAEHALDRQPGCFEALACRALALDGLGRYAEALASGEQAVAAAPQNARARFYLASASLCLGQMTVAAWELYESRLLLLKGKPAWLSSPHRWNGESLPGGTILLHAEQGLGDTLQFVRYAPLVAARAGRVILAVQPSLVRLLANTPGVDQVVSTEAPLPPFDLVCPLLSLPRLFQTTLDSIPPALPYDRPSQPRGRAGACLRVGLVWAGSAHFLHDRQRSLPPALLGALAALPGVQFYSLQRHEPHLAALPDALGAIDLMAGVQDFADTAALIQELDLVISVDTAVAHLAATMGKPVWLLARFLGCWRWLHDRPDSPWYPSMRIIRQARPNDWDGVMAQLRADLAAMAPTQPEAMPAGYLAKCA